MNQANFHIREEGSVGITFGIGKFCSLQVHKSAHYNAMLIVVGIKVHSYIRMFKIGYNVF